MTKKEAATIDSYFKDYKKAATFYREQGDHTEERIAQEGMHAIRCLAEMLNHTIKE